MKASSPVADRIGDWLDFMPDGTVRVHIGKVEIGQHIHHAVALAVADELELPVERVVVAPIDTRRSPDQGLTAGSRSVVQGAGSAARAAASARDAFAHAGAALYGCREEDLVFSDGQIRPLAANDGCPLHELATPELLRRPVDGTRKTRLATARTQRAGTPQALLQTLAGTRRLVHDLNWADMLHARLVRPPTDGAQLLEMPPEASGTAHVIDGSLAAIVGEDEYTVERAARRAARLAGWTQTRREPVESLDQLLTARPATTLAVVDGTPVPGEPVTVPQPTDEARTLEAVYVRPYQLHGSLGPSAAAARFENGALEVWCSSQGIRLLAGALAEHFDLVPDAVLVHHVPGSGCYGHNGADDVAFEAALLARACPGRPVLLKWTRGDEHAREPVAPAMCVRMRASLDDSGQVVQWVHETFSDTHLRRPGPTDDGTAAGRFAAGPALERPVVSPRPVPGLAPHGGIHRNADPIYDLPEPVVRKHLVHDLPLRSSAMRTLGGFMNVLAIESFLDELAAQVGIDALAFRLRHLACPRARAVLLTLRERHGGPRPGVGFARYKNEAAFAAVAVSAEVGEDASVRLTEATIVIDAGRAVDPPGLVAQAEGGFIQALGWTLIESLDFDSQGPLATDWEDYPVPRFADVPPIAVHLLEPEGAPPLGAGEAVCGPAGAAIANAVAARCGVRVRTLPITPDRLRRSALR